MLTFCALEEAPPSSLEALAVGFPFADAEAAALPPAVAAGGPPAAEDAFLWVLGGGDTKVHARLDIADGTYRLCQPCRRFQKEFRSGGSMESARATGKEVCSRCV